MLSDKDIVDQTLFAIILEELDTALIVSIIGTIGALLGALGALLTAYYMYRNYQQNRRKPLKKDILKEIIVPAIMRLNENIEHLEKDSIGWTKSSNNDVTGHDLSVILSNRIEWGTLQRFKEDSQDLYGKLEQYDDLIDELHENADALAEALHFPVHQELETDPVVEEFDQNFSITGVLGLLVNEKDPGANLRRYSDPWPDFWEQRGGHYREIMNTIAEEELEEFRKTRGELLAISKNLRIELKTERDRLQSKYGISYDELKTDENGLN